MNLIYYHRPGHVSLVEGQRQALLVTGGGPRENNAVKPPLQHSAESRTPTRRSMPVNCSSVIAPPPAAWGMRFNNKPGNLPGRLWPNLTKRSSTNEKD